MVKLTKAKTFQAYLDSCHRRYSCVHCRAHLANHDDLISKSFQGSQGRAYLFNSVVDSRMEGYLVEEKSNTSSTMSSSAENCKNSERPHDEGEKSIKGGQLNQHKRIHTQGKSYPCDQCWRVFTQLSGLKIHRRIHTGEKPYLWEPCEKSFSLSSSLEVHKYIYAGESCQCTHTVSKAYLN